MFEAFYGVNIASGVTLKPYVQYVVHPDQIGYVPPRRLANATVVGLQLNFNVNAAFGLPYFVPHCPRSAVNRARLLPWEWLP